MQTLALVDVHMPPFRAEAELHAADMVKAVGAATLQLLLDYALHHVCELPHGCCQSMRCRIRASSTPAASITTRRCTVPATRLVAPTTRSCTPPQRMGTKRQFLRCCQPAPTRMRATSTVPQPHRNAADRRRTHATPQRRVFWIHARSGGAAGAQRCGCARRVGPHTPHAGRALRPPPPGPPPARPRVRPVPSCATLTLASASIATVDDAGRNVDRYAQQAGHASLHVLLGGAAPEQSIFTAPARSADSWNADARAAAPFACNIPRLTNTTHHGAVPGT